MYEVTERQQLYEKASFEREKDAIEELYEIVKFRCRIKSIPIQLDVSEIDAIGTSDTDLELLLIDGNLWLPDTEEEHLLKLQEKLNNYIYFLESKQYVERYGDKFDKKSSISHSSIPHLIMDWPFLRRFRKCYNRRI